MLSQSPQIGSSLLINIRIRPPKRHIRSQSPQIGSSLLIKTYCLTICKTIQSQSPQIGSSLLISSKSGYTRAGASLNPLKSGLLF